MAKKIEGYIKLQIEAAKAKVKAAQDKVDSVTRQQSIMKNSSSEDTETELAKAQNEMLSNNKRNEIFFISQ